MRACVYVSVCAGCVCVPVYMYVSVCAGFMCVRACVRACVVVAECVYA